MKNMNLSICLFLQSTRGIYSGRVKHIVNDQVLMFEQIRLRFQGTACQWGYGTKFTKST